MELIISLDLNRIRRETVARLFIFRLNSEYVIYLFILVYHEYAAVGIWRFELDGVFKMIPSVEH